MNELQKKQSIQMLTELYLHPISVHFDDIETNDVKSALKNQIPLKQIFENLKNNEYQTPQQLINEINKLITNYEKSSNTPEYYFYQIMAVEFHRIFQKLSEKYFPSVDSWCNLVSIKRQKIGDLLKKPEIPHGNTENLIEYSNGQISDKLLKEKDMKSIIQATSQITDQEDMSGLIDVIYEKQPSLLTKSKVISIDLTRLHPDTAEAVFTYLKDVFKKKSMPFPEC